MSVEQQLRGYILENFLFTDDPSAIADGDSFLKNGIIDSTGMLEVIYFIEDRFGVVVQEDEMIPQNLDSINNIAAYVRRKTSG